MVYNRFLKYRFKRANKQMEISKYSKRDKKKD